MGYCARVTECDFRIDKSKISAALGAVRALANYHEFIAWVDKDELRSAVTLDDAIEAWGQYLTEGRSTPNIVRRTE